MTKGERWRMEVLAEFDAWLPRIATGEVTTVEIVIRPYRREGQEVASKGIRETRRVVDQVRA